MILAKIKAWLIGAGTFVLLILSAWAIGRRKGQVVQKAADAAQQAKANVQAAEQVQQVQESRHETDAENAALPNAGPQKVADADPATAAGKLRDDGWVRP